MDLGGGSRAHRYNEEGCTARDLEECEKNCLMRRVTAGSGSDCSPSLLENLYLKFSMCGCQGKS